jgi:hypothetical protein
LPVRSRLAACTIKIAPDSLDRQGRVYSSKLPEPRPNRQRYSARICARTNDSPSGFAKWSGCNAVHCAFKRHRCMVFADTKPLPLACARL